MRFAAVRSCGDPAAGCRLHEPRCRELSVRRVSEVSDSRHAISAFSLKAGRIIAKFVVAALLSAPSLRYSHGCSGKDAGKRGPRCCPGLPRPRDRRACPFCDTSPVQPRGHHLTQCVWRLGTASATPVVWVHTAI